MGSGAHGFTNVKSNPTHAHMHSYRHTHSHTHTHLHTYTHSHTRTYTGQRCQTTTTHWVCAAESARALSPPALPDSLTHLATHSASVSLSLLVSLQVFLFRRSSSCRVNPCACASTCVNVCVGTRVALSTVLRALPLLLHASPPFTLSPLEPPLS